MNSETINDRLKVFNADAFELYDQWESPTTIIADGPYGVGGFPGDPPTPEGLDKWYEPHIEQWALHATPETTLWFWNTEIGWATVHPILQKYGWQYRCCHIWDKGIGHVAGNANSKTLRKLPVVTEVCVQYVKKASFRVEGEELDMQDWLRHEWSRTGLPFSLTNEACEVKNAATRKYFTKCHLWYYPPPEAFERLVQYANEYGEQAGKPYFSLDGKKPLTQEEWTKMRAKFECPYGVTNVWHEPPLNGSERLKNGYKSMHLNQKPLKLMRLIVELSSDENDMIWEPFGGLCSGALAASMLFRRAVAAEINNEIYRTAIQRLKREEESSLYQLFFLCNQ